MRQLLLAFFIIWLISACQQNTSQPPTNEEIVETQQHLSPDQRFGELFHTAQMKEIFTDGKVFVDMIPKYTTEEILENYQLATSDENFNLKGFIINNFDFPPKHMANFKPDTTRTLKEHIEALLPALTRPPDKKNNSSLLALPNAYVVSNPQSRDIQYGDAYFTILALEASNRVAMIEKMVDNFAYLINEFGYIPQGNRTYYLGRSHPPFFAAMVNVLAKAKTTEKEAILEKYLPSLEKEYQFWMRGEEKLIRKETTVINRVIRLPDGSILNRYYDDLDTPRPEFYKEDIAIAAASNRPTSEMYRHLRSSAESGWDHSSRWLLDGENINSIATADIISVDLNSLLYHLEMTISKAQYATGNNEQAEIYKQKAQQRQRAMETYLWDEKGGFYGDYNFVSGRLTGTPSLAMIYPLFFNIASAKYAEQVAQTIEKDFLQAGGVISTLNHSGQQWDAPYGWAHLQWMTIQGLRNYEENELADTISQRWIALNAKVYEQTGKILEKYNVVDTTLESSMELYSIKDGFGWSNGVLLKLLDE